MGENGLKASQKMLKIQHKSNNNNKRKKANDTRDVDHKNNFPLSPVFNRMTKTLGALFKRIVSNRINIRNIFVGCFQLCEVDTHVT